MKRHYLKLAMVFLIGFGILRITNPLAARAEVIEINHASPHAPGSVDDKIVQEWYDEIYKRTGGKVKGNVFSGGALGKAPDMLKLVASGSAGSGTLLAFTHWYPAVRYFMIPFQFPGSPAATLGMYDFYYRGYLDKGLKGCKFMFMAATDHFHLFTVKKKITSLEDVKGLKIRAASPEIATTIKAYGGIPVTIHPSDLYMAVEKGTVDGVITSMGLIKGARLYELVKYALWEPLGLGLIMNLMNKKQWERLPADAQAAIMEINPEMAYRYMNYRITEGIEGEDFMKKHGAEVVYLSDAERSKWKRIAEEVHFKAVKESWKKAGLPADELMRQALRIAESFK